MQYLSHYIYRYKYLNHCSGLLFKYILVLGIPALYC